MTGARHLTPSGQPGERVVQRLASWHYRLLDMIIENPGISYRELGAMLRKHPEYVGRIVRSDLFQEQLSRRRRDLEDAQTNRIQGKLEEVAEKGLDTILETMNTKGSKIPFREQVDATRTVLDKLGYGVQPTAPTSPAQQNNVVVNVDADILRAAREEAKRRAQDIGERTLEEKKNGQSARLDSGDMSGGPVIEGTTTERNKDS